MAIRRSAIGKLTKSMRKTITNVKKIMALKYHNIN